MKVSGRTRFGIYTPAVDGKRDTGLRLDLHTIAYNVLLRLEIHSDKITGNQAAVRFQGPAGRGGT